MASRILGHGVDIIECPRLAKMLTHHGDRLLHRVFTPHEQAYCQKHKERIQHLAGRFAAKEAVLKVLGTGWRGGIAWTDVEIRNEPSGQPFVFLTGKTSEVAEGLGVTKIHVSISHIATHAIASAIGVGK